MAEIVGGCLCGQVRYSGTAEPMFTGVCHCKDCQRETGTAFNIVIAVPQAAPFLPRLAEDLYAKGRQRPGRCAPVLSELRFDDNFGAGGDARHQHHPRRHA